MAKPGIGLGVLTPELCPECLDSSPGIGMDGQMHARVLRYRCGNSWLPPSPSASSGDGGHLSRVFQPRLGEVSACLGSKTPWGSRKPSTVLPCCAHRLPPTWLPVHPLLGAAVPIADH